MVWSDTRYFFPVQMIKVSPLSISRFLTRTGALVLRSEIKWVWVLLIALGIWGDSGGRSLTSK
jgi:inner membrane protein